MSAPNQQNSDDLYIVTYEVVEREANSYFGQRGYGSEPEFTNVTRQKYVIVGKSALYEYKGHKNVKFYRATEVFPKFEVVIKIDV